MQSQRKVGLEIFREKIPFQRKTESLDWKKIASIDIENLIQEGDTSQLAELISCVTFCKADSEFDHGRLDPGFIKVFRISQLISECLLASHEGCAQSLKILQEKYNESEKEKGKLSEEVLHLKETLTSAKKELKKRKEMLASSQNEILGQNNSDEYDQCPYCTKRFMSSVYLLAHIQRRHQGLPVNPFFPSYPPGGTSTTAAMLCHHHQLLQSQALPNHPPPQHQTQHQHPSVAGSVESLGQGPPAPQISPHLLMNHHHQQQSQYPVIQIPTPSMLYGINQLGQQNTPSFSGSVTSLNQVASTPANNETNAGERESYPKRDFFTQTVISGENAKYSDGDEEDKARKNVEPGERLENVGLNPESLTVKLGEMGRDRKSQEAIKDNENNGHRKTDSFAQTDEIPNPNTDDAVHARAILELEKYMAHIGLIHQSQNIVSGLKEMGKVRESDPGNNDNANENLQKKDSCTQYDIFNKDVGVGGDGIDAEEKPNDISEDSYSVVSEPVIVQVEHDERKDEVPDTDHHFITHPQRKSLARQKSVKKPDFDLLDKDECLKSICKIARKIAEVSPKHENDHDEDEEEEMNEDDERSSNLSEASEANDSADEGETYNQGRSKTSQLAAVRAKTIKELEKKMADMGLNPEGKSIGKEEMGDAMKHIRSQRTRSSSKEQIQVKETSDRESEKSDNDNTTSYSERRISFSQTVISNKNGGGGDGGRDAEQKSEDDISEYTLSESVDLGHVDPNEDPDRRHQLPDQHHHPHHPRGKSSFKQTPVKRKKYVFDKEARKIVEVSHDDDDDEDYNERSSGVNSDDDDNDVGERREDKSKKSQLDLVRAKTIMELEKNMSDIGLNPESTAIGLEEMGRALKHLKSQRRNSAGEQIHDQEQFELERNAVKSFAKFQATKSAIDEKLEAISTLNTTNKPKPSSFVKMFSAVKISGKNFRKRVASAVKRRQKELSSAESEDDEENAGGDAKAENKKGKRKAASAPALKTTFFSKALWTRKKKAEGPTPTPSKGTSLAKHKDGEVKKNDSESETSSEEESGEEIVLHPYMTRSKPVLPRKRASPAASSPSHSEHSTRERRSRSGSSARRTRSRSFSRSASKPLKRLNSSANSNSSQNSSPRTFTSSRKNKTHTDQSEDYHSRINDDDNDASDPDSDHRVPELQRPETRGRDSSDTSPFSNVDEDEEVVIDKKDDHPHRDAKDIYESSEESESEMKLLQVPSVRKIPVAAPRSRSGLIETVQVRSASAYAVKKDPVQPYKDDDDDDKDETSDLEQDIHDLLTMSDDDRRMRQQPLQQRPVTPTRIPQPSSFGLNNNSFARRNTGLVMQPTNHGINRSAINAPVGGLARGRGSRNMELFSIPNRDTRERDTPSPANSWDSWNTRK